MHHPNVQGMKLINDIKEILVPLILIGSYAQVNTYVPTFLWCLWRAPWNDLDKMSDPWYIWDTDNVWFYFRWYFLWVGNLVFWILPALIWPFTFFRKFEHVTHWFIFFLNKVLFMSNFFVIVLTGIILAVGGAKYKANTLFTNSEVWITFAVYLTNAIASQVTVGLFLKPLVNWSQDHQVDKDE